MDCNWPPELDTCHAYSNVHSTVLIMGIAMFAYLKFTPSFLFCCDCNFSPITPRSNDECFHLLCWLQDRLFNQNYY